MEIGSKDKDSIITVLICPVNLFFYGSKKNFPISDLLLQIYEKSLINATLSADDSAEIFYLCFNRIQPL